MADLIYIPSKDVYISTDGGIYTDEELDDINRMEREWRANLIKELPKTVTQWLKVFPEATRQARRAEKEKIKKYKQELRDVSAREEEYYDRYIAPAHFTEVEELKKEGEKEFDEQRKEINSKIRSAQFTLSQINEMEGKSVGAKTTNGVTEADIERAKEVPIETFLGNDLKKHGKLAVGKCPLHGEKTGSFTIYLDQNSWWCYGCQSGGSVVDFVMQQNGVDFLTAVKQLLK